MSEWKVSSCDVSLSLALNVADTRSFWLTMVFSRSLHFPPKSLFCLQRLWWLMYMRHIGGMVQTFNAPIHNVALAINFLGLDCVVEACLEVQVVWVDMNITNMVCNAQPHLPPQVRAKRCWFAHFVKVIDAWLYPSVELAERCNPTCFCDLFC